MKNKKKKVIARIGAIFACVLLVGSLAIPAFAFDGDFHDIEKMYSDFYNYYLPSESKTLAFNQYITFLQSLESGSPNPTFTMLDYFFQSDTLYSGNIVTERTYTSGLVPNSDDAADDLEYIDNDVSGCVWINGNYYAFAGEMVRVVIGQVWQIFTPQLEIVGIIDNSNLLRISFVNERNSDVSYGASSITSFSAVFSHRIVRVGAFPNNPTASIIADLLFSDSNIVSHPDAFAYGWESTYSSMSYQKGYDDAVADIDSGKFGKNLLGSIFRAPFDALNSFTLVQWTTDAGTTMSISLGTIISAGIGIALFIWFLKLFAGG